MISFLIPTRKRLEHLRKSIESLESTCANLGSFEILLAFDEDDVETIEGFRRLAFRSTIRHFVMPRHGYNGLHLYYNTLAVQANGDWLWLWNDDCIMVSKDWDKTLAEHNGRFRVVYPHNLNENYHVMFPIVPKRWVELLGVFSRWNHNDTYVWYLVRPLLGAFTFEHRITHIHPWPRLQDEVTSEITYNKDCPWPLLLKDRQIIQEHLKVGPLRFALGHAISICQRLWRKFRKLP